MFDQQVPQQSLSPLQELQQIGRGLAEQTAPMLREKFGYESPEREMRRIASETDLSNVDSVQETFNTLMSKNPQAAIAWRKSVMPIVKSNIEQQKLTASAKGTPTKAKEAHLQAVRNRMIAAKGPEEGERAFGSYLQAQNIQMQGSLPQGTRMTSMGTLELIPLSPAAAKVKQAAEKQKMATEGLKRQADLVVGTINEVKELAEKETDADPIFGITGAAVSFLPANELVQNRANMDALVTQLEARIGFDELAKMRAQSPTGGALGQVSEMELKQLNASIGSLSRSQSKEQFLYNLTKVQGEYAYILDKIKRTGDGTYVSPNINKKTNNPLDI